MSSPKWHAGPSGGAEGERFEEVLDLHENHDNPFAGAAGANQGGAWGGGEGNSRAAVTEPPTGARSGKFSQRWGSGRAGGSQAPDPGHLPGAKPRPAATRAEDPIDKLTMEQTEQAKRIDNALRQREAELERRERFLQRRERDLEQGGVVIKRKNWPICRPFTYHSISDDIPVHNQAAVRAGYVNWMGGVACFVFNWLAITVLMSIKASKVSIADFFFAFLVVVVAIPVTWMGWYRGFYRAAKTDGALMPYMRVFMLLSLEMLWCVWVIVAPPLVGKMAAGFFTLVRTGSNLTAIVFIVVNIILWGLHLLFCAYVMGAAIRAFKGNPDARISGGLFRAGDRIFGSYFDARRKGGNGAGGGQGQQEAAGTPAGAGAFGGGAFGGTPGGAFGP